jgi:hypothetical protein
LVPIDFSDASLEALRHAKELALTYGAQITLLHAVEEVVYPSAYGVEPANLPGPQVIDRVEESLADLARTEIGYEHVVVQANVGYAPSTIIDYAEDRPSPRTIVPLRVRGGKVNRINPSATAFAERRSPYLLSIDSTWVDPEDDEANIEWTREFWEAMEPYASESMYFNFSMLEEGTDMVRTTFRENYERLVDVKTTYDPGNLFRLNQNIEPAG